MQTRREDQGQENQEQACPSVSQLRQEQLSCGGMEIEEKKVARHDQPSQRGKVREGKSEREKSERERD